MKRRLAQLCIAAALAFSCSKPSESPGAPASTGEAPSATAVAPPPDPEPPLSAEAEAEPAPEACVKECVEKNQMRAEAAQKIEADCRQQCR